MPTIEGDRHADYCAGDHGCICGTKGTGNPRTPNVHTREYEMSHQRQPRGTGSWGFAPCDAMGRHVDYDRVAWFQGTFRAARNQAYRHFAYIAPDIAVCP